VKLDDVELGGPVHFASFGGNGPPVVLVHGLGGSLANWMAVGGPLSARYKVFAPDLAGFGRTPLAGRVSTVEANVALLARFIEEVAGAPAIVAGNSMGGLIAAVLASSRPELVSRLVLVSAALPRPIGAPADRKVAALFGIYMIPVLGTAFLRWHMATVGPEQSTRETLRLCGVNPDKLPPEIFAALVRVARDRLAMPWAHEAFIKAARSIVTLTAQRRRFQDMLLKIRAPTLVIQGTRDRLVPLAAAEDAVRLRRDWKLSVFDGVGHVPQLEVPERWLSTVHGFLDEIDRQPSAALGV
jgi:pimeloyl-ACP methyl ester carboxylesterase